MTSTGTTSVAILPEDLVSTLLPENTTNASSQGSAVQYTFVRLPHPRTDVPSLYLPKPVIGDAPSQILEVQSVAPNNERSWFIGNSVVSDGRLLLFTPIDPIFLLIPILRAVFVPDPNDPTPPNFRTAEDIIEEASIRITEAGGSLPPSQTHLDSPVRQSANSRGKGREDRPIVASDVIAFGNLDCVQSALGRICETKDIASDMRVYRYSPSKLLDVIREKVTRLAKPEVFGTFSTLRRGLDRACVTDEASSLEPEKREELTSSDHSELAMMWGLTVMRIKASCDVLGQYLPPDLLASLLKFYDFTALDAFLAAAEPEAAPLEESRPIKSRKEKKDPEGGKKKKAASRAAEALKKVDTKGMNKLSTFFKKKE